MIKLFEVLSQEKEYILTQQKLVNNWSFNITVSVYSLTLCQRTPWVLEKVTTEGTAYKRTSLKPRERKYSQTPLNTDTSLLRTVCFVPGERKSLDFISLNTVNTDTLLIWTNLWPPQCPISWRMGIYLDVRYLDVWVYLVFLNVFILIETICPKSWAKQYATERKKFTSGWHSSLSQKQGRLRGRDFLSSK